LAGGGTEEEKLEKLHFQAYDFHEVDDIQIS